MTQPTSVLCRGLFPIASMGREHFYPGRRQLFVQRVVVICVPTENFMRIGGGHTVKRRLQNRGGADCQIAEEGFDSRIESEPQPAVEAGLQGRGVDISALQGAPGLLSVSGRGRNASGIGSRLSRA